MNTISSFGDWVRRQRRKLDLTQAALAAQVGCAPVTIKKIEQETRRPSLEMAELLARHLEIPLAQHVQFVRAARGEQLAAQASIIPGSPSPLKASSLESMPAFGLHQEPDKLMVDTPVEYFVARDREMLQLTSHLAGAVNGSGRVVFVTGEAGSGKTSLLAAFARQAQDLYPDLIVAGGNCDAFAGVGDPYMPFRDVMSLLTGDVETKWKAGRLGQEQARRLWALVPQMARILEEVGPDLIDLLISGAGLILRALAQAPEQTDRWLALQARLENRPRGSANLAQRQIFTQYTEVLRQLAGHRPVVIMLDDLHWTDRASAGLLFHLGRRLSDARLMILGAFRPDELMAARRDHDPTDPTGLTDSGEEQPAPEHPAAEHPVVPILHEFKRRYGDIEIDLNRRTAHTGRSFVDALLDQEPNHLGDSFRTALVARTEGHPLFTVEMLRDMQERGDLIQDEAGFWREGRDVDWETLPARVEAVIGRRLEILPDFLLDALKIAGVEGETFTAEVVAHIAGIDRRQMLRHLSATLGRRHQLVRSQDSRRLGAQSISRYRFGHILFQKYLYDYLLDASERAVLHEAVGEELETLYAGELELVAVQLAHHFKLAGLAAKAVTYLRMAGERAVRLSAHEEAIAHFLAALALRETLPPTAERDAEEFHLRIALGVSLVTTKGWPAPETEAAYARAYKLVRRIPYAPDMGPALSGLHYTYTAVYFVRGHLTRALAMSRACLQLAQERDDPMLYLAAHAMMGPSLYHMGQLEQARTYTEQGSSDYAALRRQSHVLVHGPDLGVFCSGYTGHICWTLGYPDRAVEQCQQALAIAQEQAHPFSVVVASCYLAMLYQFRGDCVNVQAHADVALALCTQYEFVYYTGWAEFLLGWVETQQGEVAAGLAQMGTALQDLRGMGTGLRSTYYLALMAEAQGQLGEVDRGLALLEEAFAWMEAHDERYYAAELHRLRGELLLQQVSVVDADAGNERYGEAVDCFQTALTVARQQGAKILELRALTSLCRVQRGSDVALPDACTELAQLYAWFTEGFTTPDLQIAHKVAETNDLGGETAHDRPI